jgi:hypothetical protein
LQQTSHWSRFFASLGLLHLTRHPGLTAAAVFAPTAKQGSTDPQQPEKPPVVMFVDRGQGKYPIYSVYGKAGDPLRLSGDALEKYGRDRQFFIIVDSRLPIGTLAETDAYPEKAGFASQSIRYFENYGDGKMSELTWGPVVPVPGGHRLP